MRTVVSIVTIFMFPFFLSEEKPTPLPETIYDEYCNSRFDFCVEYPITFFPQKVVSDNGDGISVKSPQQDLQMTVAGSKNLLQKNTWELFNSLIREPLQEEENTRIIYMIIRPDYYETAFYKEGKCFYQKLIRSGSDNIIFEMQAPREQYDRLRNIKRKVSLDW